MLYSEIIAVCSQIHTKHINTLCGQNVVLLNVKLAVHIATTGLKALSGCGARTEAYIARKRLQNKHEARPVFAYRNCANTGRLLFAAAHYNNITVIISSGCATSGS